MSFILFFIFFGIDVKFVLILGIYDEVGWSIHNNKSKTHQNFHLHYVGCDNKSDESDKMIGK